MFFNGNWTFIFNVGWEMSFPLHHFHHSIKTQWTIVVEEPFSRFSSDFIHILCLSVLILELNYHILKLMVFLKSRYFSAPMKNEWHGIYMQYK